MTRRVVFAPEVEGQLAELHGWIADRATAEVAERFVERIIEHCESLAAYPHRGRARDDIREGLRTTTYAKRTVVAFSVTEDLVTVLGIFHGGRDYERSLGVRD